MRFPVLAVLLSPLFITVPALADPVPGVNIALVRDGREAAATTTLQDGGATLQAAQDGEYGLALQSTLTTDARLTATVREEVWSVDLAAGVPSRDAALSFPARADDVIQLCMETLAGAADPDAPTAVPAPTCAVESTQGAGHGLADALADSDLNPALPAPAAVVPDPAPAAQ